MSGFFTQNRSNTLTLPIQCTVNVASYRETAVRIAGTLQIDTLHAVSLKLKTCMHKSGGFSRFMITHPCMQSHYSSSCFSALTLWWWQLCSLSAVLCVCKKSLRVLISSSAEVQNPGTGNQCISGAPLLQPHVFTWREACQTCESTTNSVTASVLGLTSKKTGSDLLIHKRVNIWSDWPLLWFISMYYNIVLCLGRKV